MQQKIKEIASRVKELRELSGVSADDLAKFLKISSDKYFKYEKGEEDFPASILVELAQKLGVETAVLLTGKNPHMSIFTVTRAGKGERVEWDAKNLKSTNIAGLEPIIKPTYGPGYVLEESESNLWGYPHWLFRRHSGHKPRSLLHRHVQ